MVLDSGITYLTILKLYVHLAGVEKLHPKQRNTGFALSLKLRGLMGPQE